MRLTRVEFAKLPLGLRFIDSQGRIFEIIETFYGPLTNIKWTIETTEGQKIHAADWDAAQTAVGFRKMIGAEYTGDVIIRTIEEMDTWFNNNNLRKL
jgi:hypothetical protein